MHRRCAGDNTGITLSPGRAEQNDKIIRYSLPADSILPNGPPQIVRSGLPLTGDHPMHPFASMQSQMFVDLGAATNSCQVENRMPNSPRNQPCTELETRAGTRLYEANKILQHFSPAERYATGLRNGERFAFDVSGRLFVTQHGRDQLSQNWSKFYTSEQSARQPAEEIVLLERGAYYGWPECYYDRFPQKLVLEPEYGGDAGKAVGVCAKKTAPVAALPAHWAPNDMLIYAGNEFPASYQGGRLRQVETGLALCAEPAATVAPYVQSAVYANLVPRLDMLKSLGLVWMPGVMAGGVGREPRLCRHLSIRHRRHDPRRLRHHRAARYSTHASTRLLSGGAIDPPSLSP
jgi:Uncharacterised protein family (UPF0014)